jgi:hypothetical protein
MKHTLVAVLIAAATLAAQTPTPEPADARAVAAMQALDRYLETWNSRDAKQWASSLHFPHIRPGPGAFELSATSTDYIKGVNFEQTLATGWHHSEWVTRRVLHVTDDKAHIAGAWQRYTADDRPLVGSVITYVVTRQAGRWGVLSRFAAGPSGLAVDASEANARTVRAAVSEYFKAWNTHNHQTLAAALHYPHVRVDGAGAVEVWRSADEFLLGSEPARQRTWFETRLDQADVVQVSANGVNVAVRYSRRDREGRILSQADAVLLVVGRSNVWKIQAVSTMGT